MTPETAAEIEIILAEMPRGTAPEWSSRTTEFYASQLADYPDVQIKAAVNYLVGKPDQKFRPMPGEIKAAITSIFSPARTAADELARLRRSIQRRGQYCIPPSEDKPWWKYGPPPKAPVLVLKTIDALGGWESVCCEYAPHVLTAQFERLYTAIASNAGDSDLQQLRLAADEQRQMQADSDYASLHGESERGFNMRREGAMPDTVKQIVGSVGRTL